MQVSIDVVRLEAFCKSNQIGDIPSAMIAGRLMKPNNPKNPNKVTDEDEGVDEGTELRVMRAMGAIRFFFSSL